MITAYSDVFAEKLARLEERIAGIRSTRAIFDDDDRLAMREAEAARLRRVLDDLKSYAEADLVA